MLNKLKLAAVGSLLLAPVGHAQTYYTIDVNNDVLYTINVSTGVATPVGPLGVNMESVDMAWNQGALYARNIGTAEGNRIFQVLTHGMFKGMALPGAPIAIGPGGYNGAALGGFASNGTELFLAYSVEAPGGNNSNRFGKVDPLTGVIIFPNPPNPTIIPTDADSMGFAGTEFWSIDGISGNGYRLYKGSALTGPSTFVFHGGEHDPKPEDLEVLLPDRLVAIGETGIKLVHIIRATGVIGTEIAITGTPPLPPNFSMHGLARQPNPCASVFAFPFQPHP